jgi:hypothetical protein
MRRSFAFGIVKSQDHTIDGVPKQRLSHKPFTKGLVKQRHTKIRV